MGFDIIKKGENYHNRVDGSNVPPLIKYVAGNGSQFSQAWKVGQGERWGSDGDPKIAKTNGLQGFFHRDNGNKD